MNDFRQPDSPAYESAAAIAATPLAQPAAGRQWSGVLEFNAEENLRIVNEVLASHRRARPLLLGAVRNVFRMWSGLRVAGLEHLPAKPPYVLATNHQCHLDNLFVACFLPPAVQRRMVVLSKKEHFDFALTRLVAKLCHAIPVDRALDSAGVLGLCAQVLGQGNVLLIHPEGTRSPDGRLQPFKKGVAVLAHYVKCPVVPVRIDGAFEFWPKQSFLPRRRSRISITIGAPIHPPAIARQDADEFTRTLTSRIVALGATAREPRAADRHP